MACDSPGYSWDAGITLVGASPGDLHQLPDEPQGKADENGQRGRVQAKGTHARPSVLAGGKLLVKDR